jgi:hypothetical protein
LAFRHLAHSVGLNRTNSASRAWLLIMAKLIKFLAFLVVSLGLLDRYWSAPNTCAGGIPGVPQDCTGLAAIIVGTSVAFLLPASESPTSAQANNVSRLLAISWGVASWISIGMYAYHVSARDFWILLVDRAAGRPLERACIKNLIRNLQNLWPCDVYRKAISNQVDCRDLYSA